MASANKTVVASGGFVDEEQVESSDPEVDTDILKARHKETVTRMILHCTETQVSTIVIVLLAHLHKMTSDKVWLKAGIAANRKYIPIHTIVKWLAFDNDNTESIRVFHSITGGDSFIPLQEWRENLLESVSRILSPS
ncbi:hypothetical protein SK128_008156 [Halocaridina rubra]|uniref:Uncharacterized protein n=1 Tax=Halocaridina rubra TaxID=373956 RepID=A0AAN8X9F1_HALRR